MAHSKKGRNNKMLSPGNYIRQKARSLPIHECLINANWESSKIASVILSRRHVNGNMTVGLYLADLLCQGIKDTAWRFNISPVEYESFKESLSARQEMDLIPYELAHNIVFATHEFALECGLDSHPDFTSTTRFLLEEDSDKIELIDIECGEESVPVVVSSPGQSRSQIINIISKLEKTVGSDNFKIRLSDFNNEDYDDQ